MAADGTATAPPTVRTLLNRGRARGSGGFGCRLRLLPRYCASAAAAEGDAAAAAATAEAAKDEPVQVAAATAAAAAPPGSPRSSLGKRQDALPASLGLGASLVLLLSKSAAELSRMAELRAQMERLLLDAKADVRSCNGRPSALGDRADCASVVKVPVVPASEDGGRRDMDRMEAELEAELSRLRLQRASDASDSFRRRRRGDAQIEVPEGTKSSASSRSHSRSTICSDRDNDDGEIDNSGSGDESQDRYDEDGDDDREADEGDGIKSPPHGGVSARDLELRLHQLLQSRHEARIAELESALERARRKLRETEREACRWRDTAKLATRFADDTRLR